VQILLELLEEQGPGNWDQKVVDLPGRTGIAAKNYWEKRIPEESRVRIRAKVQERKLQRKGQRPQQRQQQQKLGPQGHAQEQWPQLPKKPQTEAKLALEAAKAKVDTLKISLIAAAGAAADAKASAGKAEPAAATVAADAAPQVCRLAALYHSLGRYGETEPLLREALEGACRALPKGHPSLLRATKHLGLLYQSMGRDDEAEALLAESTDAVAAAAADEAAHAAAAPARRVIMSVGGSEAPPAGALHLAAEEAVADAAGALAGAEVDLAAQRDGYEAEQKQSRAAQARSRAAEARETKAAVVARQAASGQPPPDSARMSPTAPHSRRQSLESNDLASFMQQTEPARRSKPRPADKRTPSGSFCCTYEDCPRSFLRQAALTTHIGWHKRQEKMDSGQYDEDDNNREEMSVLDENGAFVSVAASLSPLHPCSHPLSCIEYVSSGFKRSLRRCTAASTRAAGRSSAAARRCTRTGAGTSGATACRARRCWRAGTSWTPTATLPLSAWSRRR
jgi:hypothetical protein